MNRRFGVACAMLALSMSCARHDPHQVSGIGVRLNSPRTLLDGVDTVTLSIVDAHELGVVCSENSGLVTVGELKSGLLSIDLQAQEEVVKVPLSRTMPNGAPCPNQGVFCSDEITLPTDPSKLLVFQAEGRAGTTPVAVGCTTAAVNSDPFYVNLSMFRYVKPAICGNGSLEVGEQCERGEINCDDLCRTVEFLISTDHEGPSNQRIENAPPGSKQGVRMAWSHAPQAANPSPLHLVFGDTNYGKTGTGPEINYRQLGQHAEPIEYPPLLSSQIRLPLLGAKTPGFDQRPRTQAAAAIGLMSDGSFVVAYEDDRLSTGPNISFTPISMDASLPRSDEVSINTLGVDASGSPAVAGGPTDRALVAWVDQAGRRIRARIWAVTGWISSSETTLSAQEGDSPRIAGWNEGWVVVWHGRSKQDNDDIMAVRISQTGEVGAPFSVNTETKDVQQQPDVAALPTGEVAVVWNSAGRIFLQRFDASGQPIAGDQSAPVNDDSAMGENPAIAASPLAAGFFAISWQTAAGIRARLIDRSGDYLPNAVDGQTGSFLVNRDDVNGMRSHPSVAIGGAGHIVFAWEDSAADHSGIYARRFPLPVR
ncbi:MAG TPA: hypothetical protein PLJ27_17045 [Polyangiaceae bacterium]|jgi:hypothetical protein|nr:MAG: hypothetical protein BWY17_01945 [Deltaproteobacteria bacterium ADurb.Bin207]HNS97580.1 hypothetical protein [Polyangiaceae bacterium]HNZ21756.1 hypothetical protein [Polyangiaceae bacterium]HOD25052.1 hypothetical protein [Polyangiaceae bacterium]HOE50777.1 hypothetical protein [Polyangiaceae bacterium]